jgi:hypothetical protein
LCEKEKKGEGMLQVRGLKSEKTFFRALKKHLNLMIYPWNPFLAVAYCISINQESGR